MIDMIGKKFGRLTVIKSVRKNKCGDTYFKCKCECGSEIEALGANLRRNLTKSCGCLQKEIASSIHAKNIAGQKFGYLTAIEPTDKRSGSFIVWRCHCDYCGNDNALISIGNLMNGQVSCGKCSYAADRARERMTIWKTAIEKVLALRFCKMVSRCYNKRNPDYADYGGRGIYICDEWTEDRHNFVKWGIESGFKPGLSIDRIDNDGPYAPWNCRWVDDRVQQNNRRSNRFITVDGTTETISEWAFLIDVKPILLYQLSRVDSEGTDLKEYIEYKWSKLTDSEKDVRFKKLYIKEGISNGNR